MRQQWMRLFCLAAAVLLAVAGPAVAQDRYSDFQGDEHAGAKVIVNDYEAEGAGSSLAFYTDRGTFDAANPGLPLEDYTGTLIPPNNVSTCDAPIDSSSNDACFTPGGVLDGVAVDVTVDGGQSLGGNGLAVVLTVGFLGVTCNAVGPNSFADEGDIDFDPPVRGVGLDFVAGLFGGTETFDLEIFGPGGSLGSTVISAAGAPVFFGVDTSDPGGISRIEVREQVDGTGELFCNIAFGGVPVPVELQSFSIDE